MKSRWIVHGTDRAEADVNVLLFTYAGGSPSLFAPWKKLFDSRINLCPVLYPGRELRKEEQMPESIGDMAADFVDENKKLFEKDFVLFGHCTGNLIAYETAKYVFKKLRKCPLLFLVSGSNSPRSSDFARLLQDDDGKEVSDDVLAGRMISQGLVTEDFFGNQAFREYYLPIYRNDLKMISRFREKEPVPLSCAIRIMYGDEDEFLTSEGLRDWESYTTKAVEYEAFPGSHFYLTSQKERVTGRITQYIAHCREEACDM